MGSLMHYLIVYLTSIFTIFHVSEVVQKPLFPKPIHSSGERTAVMISGELRSGNVTFASRNIHLFVPRGTYRYPRHFEDDDPRTPIQTILENLITPLAEYGGVDLFIYMPVPRDTPIDMAKIHAWDGNPLTYQPYPGDNRVCELYSRHPAFDPSTGNKVFCYTEFSRQLLNYFIKNNPGWNRYDHQSDIDKEALLQQEYGKYMANLGAQQYSVMSGINYKYKVRLRFDEAMSKRFPSLETFNFKKYDVQLVFKGGKKAPSCDGLSKIVYYPNFHSHGYSAEDSFNFGESEDMDNIFNHYLYLITRPIIPSSLTHSEKWINEHDQISMLKEWYNTCLTEHRDIHITKVRLNGQDADNDRLRLTHNDSFYDSNWVYVNQYGSQ